MMIALAAMRDDVYKLYVSLKPRADDEKDNIEVMITGLPEVSCGKFFSVALFYTLQQFSYLFYVNES